MLPFPSEGLSEVEHVRQPDSALFPVVVESAGFLRKHIVQEDRGIAKCLLTVFRAKEPTVMLLNQTMDRQLFRKLVSFYQGKYQEMIQSVRESVSSLVADLEMRSLTYRSWS